MFKKTQPVQTVDGIPADLLKSIQEPAARRKRWIIEILLSLLIVVALLLGGMFVYRHFHRSNEPASVPKSNAERVTQPPQQNTDAKDQTSDPAATTPASSSTNNGLINQPR